MPGNQIQGTHQLTGVLTKIVIAHVLSCSR